MYLHFHPYQTSRLRNGPSKLATSLRVLETPHLSSFPKNLELLQQSLADGWTSATFTIRNMLLADHLTRPRLPAIGLSASCYSAISSAAFATHTLPFVIAICCCYLPLLCAISIAVCVCHCHCHLGFRPLAILPHQMLRSPPVSCHLPLPLPFATATCHCHVPFSIYACHFLLPFAIAIFLLPPTIFAALNATYFETCMLHAGNEQAGLCRGRRKRLINMPNDRKPSPRGMAMCESRVPATTDNEYTLDMGRPAG